MATFQFVATTARAPEEILSFFADMRHAASWDDSVREVQRLDGDGPVVLGSAFRVTVATPTFDVTLTYRVTVLDPSQGLVLRATNRWLISEDTVTVRPLNVDQREVTYRARLSGRGLTRLGEPLLQRSLEVIGDRASTKLRETYFS